MATYEELTYEIGKTQEFPWGGETPVEIMNEAKEITVITLNLPITVSKNGLEKDALRRVKKYHDSLSEIMEVEVHPDVKEIYAELIAKKYLTVGQTIEDLPVKVEAEK